MSEPRIDVIDNPIERLELLAGDDEAIASFLDQIDVTGPREREMLGSLHVPERLQTQNGSRPRTGVPSAPSRR